VDIEATDFVFSALSFRTSDGSFTNTDVGNIVTSLVGAAAPEVGRSQIESVGRDISISVNGRKTLDVITQDLQPAGDAIVAQDGTDLIFEPIGTVTPQFNLTVEDLHTPISVQRVDDELINRVRIDGGEDSAVDDEQLTQTTTTRVDDSTREIFQVASRKSELDSIEIFTVRDPQATEGLIVRLQAARNGSAVAPTDQTSDVARRELAPSFIAQNGFTEFLFPDHSLAPAENPFIIVEGVGSTGHEIGTDSNGNVAFSAKFPFPLLARASAGDSVEEFRQRDLRRRDDQLSNADAVENAAKAALRHRSQPKRRISANAATPRTHRLRPGQAVRVSDIPVTDVSGTYLITERTTSFDGVRLDTDLTLEDTTTL
jgi:hypothetical protein